MIDYNGASDILLDEKYIDLFSDLKDRYKDKIRGRVVIRVSALTSYLMMVEFNGDTIKVGYN